MCKKECCFGEVESLIKVSLFFLKRYVLFPNFIIEGFAVAGQFDEEQALWNVSLFLEIESNSNQIFCSEKFICFLIVEIVWISCDVDQLKFVFNIGVFDEFIDNAFVVGIEFAEGRLKERFETRGLGVSEPDSCVEAEILFLRIFLGNIIKDDGAISFGIFGVVNDFGNKGVLARLFHFKLIG